MEDRVSEAAIEYLKRKLRATHPPGKFEKSKWHPEAYFTCCSSIRAPSRAHPWSLMTHCRTATHIANEFGVEEKAIKDRVRLKSLPLLMGRDVLVDEYIAGKLKG